MNFYLSAVLPLILAALLYLIQAMGYQIFLHRPGMAIAFIGYALANLGFIYDAVTTGPK